MKMRYNVCIVCYLCHSSEAFMDSDIEFEENYDYSPVPFVDLEDDVFVIEKKKDKALVFINLALIHGLFLFCLFKIKRWFN